jgi:hypothetical protein
MILVIEDAPGWNEYQGFVNVLNRRGQVLYDDEGQKKTTDAKPRCPVEAYGAALAGSTITFEVLVVNYEIPECVIEATLIDTPPHVNKFFASAHDAVRTKVRLRWPGLAVSPSGKKYEANHFELEE